MNDSFDNYDMFSNKSYSDKKNMFLNLISLNEMNSKNGINSNNFFSNMNDPFLHLNSNRNYEKNLALNQSSGSKSNLEEIFKCFICFGRVKNAQMCPHCSKLCCNNCIKKWLTEQKSQCPHCRAPLRVSQLVNCRFVSEITTALDNLHIRKDDEEELCQTHKNKLNYYCMTCQISICSDCAMLGNTHKAHEFEHISKTYDFHVEKIKKEANGLKTRLKDLSENLNLVQNSISSLKKNKDEKATEISLILEQMNQKLESDLKSKLVVLISQKNSVSDEIEYLENMKNELEHQIKESPKNVLIGKSEDLIQMLKETNEKPTFKFNPSGLNFNFKSELVPEYDSAIYVIANYSKIRKNKDIIYSEPLQKNGLIWRLKIYPNGNGVAKGQYLSIFLELVKGLQASAKYEYRIEMINAKNPEICVIREFASDFETGECWGYNRFFKIEFLEKDGYVSLENDSIMIKYHIRALNYYQKSIDQENYIKQLENERKENLEKIQSLQKISEKRENFTDNNQIDKKIDIPQENVKEYMIVHDTKIEIEEEEEKEIKKENNKSIIENNKETEKTGITNRKTSEIITNKQQNDFSMNYFTNLDTQIESVKHNSNIISLEENNVKIPQKRNSIDPMQTSIEKMLLESEQDQNNNLKQQKHLIDFKNYDSHNNYSFEEEQDEDEGNNVNHSQTKSNSDSANDNDEDDENPNLNENELENEELYIEGQACQIHYTDTNINIEEEEESGKEEEETKLNKPERESKESLQAYLKNEHHEDVAKAECIFETGNLVKDSERLFNDETNEEHFISLDSICEKTEKSNKLSLKEDPLFFKEKIEKDKSHIRNLLPNFEIEARNTNNKQSSIKSELLSNNINSQNESLIKDEQKNNKQQKNMKIQTNSIALSENLIKKIENIKYFNQKVKNKVAPRSKDQKENVRTQENQELLPELTDNIQTC